MSRKDYGHNHRWQLFEPSEDDGSINWRGVRLPSRRACISCGVTQILVEDLTEYPHVAAAMMDRPSKVWAVTR